MLLRFSVENYLSINSAQELSLVATPLKDASEGLIESKAVSDMQVLPAAVIYGANASGKSNIIGALSFLSGAVISSHKTGGPETKIPRQCFALDDQHASRTSKFDIDFVVESVRYHFGFEATDHEFTREWLYKFPNNRRQKLYERDEAGEVTFGRALKGENLIIKKVMRKNSLFISASRQNNHDQLTKISDFFRSVKFCDYNADQVRKVSVDNFDSRITRFLGSIGTGIVTHKIEKELIPKHVIDKIINFETTSDNQDDKSRLRERLDIGFNVVKLGHNNKNGKAIYFEAEKESSGTRRLLSVLGPVFKALDEGTVVVIDEIDASLHTKICDSLLSMFADKSINKKGAQLIATTHDTNLMRSKTLRRDQIWFCEKSEFGETHLTPLSDIQTRQTDNIEKGYLDGRFGAIPFSGSLSDLMSRN